MKLWPAYLHDVPALNKTICYCQICVRRTKPCRLKNLRHQFVHRTLQAFQYLLNQLDQLSHLSAL